MPSAKPAPKPEEFFADTSEPKHPHPNITSYVTRNAAIIQSRTTNNSTLQTENNKTTDLKKGDNQDLIKILGPDYSDQFKPTYDTVDLIRYHECWRDDGIAASALDFLIQFMLGDHFKTIIDVNAEFDTEEDEKAARDSFNANKQIKGYKRKLDQINREIKFQTQLYSLLVQCMVFGRACGLLERSDIDDLPISVKILPSMHLGQVYVDRKTWNVIGVEHKDYQFPASILKSENIIYFPLRDHNVSPGTLHYGYSLLERVADLSELNRITNQRNLKEINFRLWADRLLIKMPGSYNKDTMKKLKDQLSKGAGNSIILNQAAQVETVQIKHDSEKLIDQRDQNYREMIRQLQVPIILYDPDILNRATSQELMEAWTVSVLNSYRSWLKDIIQDQWINPILKTLIENERKAAREGQDIQEIEEEPEETEKKDLEDIQEPDNPNRTPDITKEVIPIEAIDPRTGEVLVYRLNWKIKIEFESLNYDTFKEKAETAILLKNNGLSTIGAALRRMGIDDENEIAALLELEERRQELRFAEQEAVVGNTFEQNRARSVDRQKQKLQEGLRKSITGNNIPIKEGARPRRVGIRRKPVQD